MQYQKGHKMSLLRLQSFILAKHKIVPINFRYVSCKRQLFHVKEFYLLNIFLNLFSRVSLKVGTWLWTKTSSWHSKRSLDDISSLIKSKSVYFIFRFADKNIKWDFFGQLVGLYDLSNTSQEVKWLVMQIKPNKMSWLNCICF